MAALTKSLAQELGPEIRVNAVAPGPIPTENFIDSMNMDTPEKEEQLKKQNKDIWGDPSVLSVNKLQLEWKNKFINLPRGVATLNNEELQLKLEEPHPSWVKAIERQWIKNYGSSK